MLEQCVLPSKLKLQSLEPKHRKSCKPIPNMNCEGSVSDGPLQVRRCKNSTQCCKLTTLLFHCKLPLLQGTAGTPGCQKAAVGKSLGHM